MCHALQKLGYSTTFVIPNRLTDGYGNQENLVVENTNHYNTRLVITVDNGITSKNLVEKVKSMGVDIIITDHHLPDDSKIPETLIIDPKYNQDNFSDICGAVVAFKLMYALYKEIAPSQLYIIRNLLPFAGMATIADMMPVLYENRDLIKLTLSYINNIKNQQSHPLYKILYGLGGENFFRSQTEIATEELISFNIAPAINAVSRINGSVNELTQKILNTLEKPWVYFPTFKSTNFNRQKLTTEVLKDFNEECLNKHSVICTFSNEYENDIKGILGLIANKLSTKYNKVALVGTEKDSKTTEFSGRSTPIYNLHEGIERIKAQHPEFEIGGGGHAAAMGVRILTEKIEEFKTILEDDIETHSEVYDSTVFLYESEMENEIKSTMQELQPYGSGFKKLKFTYTGIFKSYDKITKMANIGDYNFRMYITEADANAKLNSEMTINFTVSFSDINGPFFSIIKE